MLTPTVLFLVQNHVGPEPLWCGFSVFLAACCGIWLGWLARDIRDAKGTR